MRFVAYDTETDLIQPGLAVPPLVCGSWASAAVTSLVPTVHDPVDADGCVELLRELLADDDVVLVGLNIFFDFAVTHQHAITIRRPSLLPAIYAKLERGLVWDVGLAEQLHAISRGLLGHDLVTGARLAGRYSLEECVRQALGRGDAKAHDEWRLRYWQLRGTPIADWPETARRYLGDDTRNPLEVMLAQAGLAPSRERHRWGAGGRCERCGGADAGAECLALEPRANLHDLAEQCRAAWALHLAGAHGFARESRVVDMIAEAYAREHAPGSDAAFRAAGIVRDDGTTSQAALKRLVVEAYTDAAALVPCPACAGTGLVPSPAALRKRDADAAAVEASAALTAEQRIKRAARIAARKLPQVQCRDCDGTGWELGPDVPRAEQGGVSCSRDALFEAGDELLASLAEYREADKVPDSYLPYLREGAPAPLTVSFRPLLETGRVSAEGLILTFPRRPGAWVGERGDPARYYRPSLREALVARPDRVLCSSDYDSGELVTWATACLRLVGSSRLAQALCAGANPHLLLGAKLLGIPYEDALARYKAKDRVVVNARQLAKEPNFGFPGGMGIPMLVIRGRMSNGVDTPCAAGPVLVSDGRGGRVSGYRGVRFCVMEGATSCGRRKVREWRGRSIKPVCGDCLDVAARLRREWGAQWPESEPYFARASLDAERGYVTQLGSGRVRGGVDFMSAANGYFQELLAYVAKLALWRVSRACYDPTLESPLYGSRVCGFFHDELITEHPIETASERADETDRIMVGAMREVCHELAPAARAPGALMRRWDKQAEPVRGADGRLLVWTPPGDDPYLVSV